MQSQRRIHGWSPDLSRSPMAALGGHGRRRAGVEAGIAMRALSVSLGPSLQICTELDPAALGPVGRTTIWRIRIKSGWKPVLIRLHNASPGVVRLEGGNDQIRHMGCVRHHEIQLKVTRSDRESQTSLQGRTIPLQNRNLRRSPPRWPPCWRVSKPTSANDGHGWRLLPGILRRGCGGASNRTESELLKLSTIGS